MRPAETRHLLFVTRRQRFITHLPHCRYASSQPSSPPQWSIKSPRDLFHYLEQYIVGQEQAKRVLSVAVFNHYQRIARLQTTDPPPEHQSPPYIPESPRTTKSSSPAPTASPSSIRPHPSSSSTPVRPDPDPSILTSDPRSDSTRIVGIGDHDGDPTLTHELTAQTKEREWAAAANYFNSAFQPLTAPDTSSTLMGKAMKKRKMGTPTMGKGTEEEFGSARRVIKALEADVAAGSRVMEEESRERTQGVASEKKNEMVEIEKSNVLMIGPTGTGKTLLTKTLARMLDVPFASCDATTYTSAGYVGEDVENCILRLLQASDYDVSRAEYGIIHIDEIDKLARRSSADGFATWGGGRDVGGEGVQQAFLRLLEGTSVVLNAKPPATTSAGSGSGGSGNGNGGGPMMSGLGGGGKDWDSGREFPGKKGVREGLPGFGGGSSGKGETFQIDTSNILFICSGAFVGLDQILNSRLGKGSIGFNASLPRPPRTPESSSQPLPLKGLQTVDLQTYGLIPEFLGRLPIHTTLNALSISDLVRILVEPKNALIKQYKAIFEGYGCELSFTKRAVEEVARKGQGRGGGARGLRGILEEVLGEGMFEIPGSSVRYCLITENVVKGDEPALYFSRGQRYVFERTLEEEDGVEEEVSREEGEGDGDERVRASG